MINKILRYLRLEHELTQEQVADVLGVTRSAYAYYEKGTSHPSIESIAKLARLYDITTDAIIGNEKPDYCSNNAAPLIGVLRDDTFPENLVPGERLSSFFSLSRDERTLVLLYRASSNPDEIISAVKKLEGVELPLDFGRIELLKEPTSMEGLEELD